MKTKLFAILVIVITLNSCMTVKHTHSEVESGIENLLKDGTITRDDIIEEWGLPTQKRTEGDYEEWYYDLGTESTSISLPSYTNTRINADSDNGLANIKSRSYGGRTVTNSINKCMIYTFKNGQAIKFETQGCDLTQKEINPISSFFAVLGSIGFIVMCGFLGTL